VLLVSLKILTLLVPAAGAVEKVTVEPLTVKAVVATPPISALISDEFI